MTVEEEDIDDDGDLSNGNCNLMMEKLPPTGKILAFSPRRVAINRNSEWYSSFLHLFFCSLYRRWITLHNSISTSLFQVCIFTSETQWGSRTHFFYLLGLPTQTGLAKNESNGTVVRGRKHPCKTQKPDTPFDNSVDTGGKMVMEEVFKNSREFILWECNVASLVAKHPYMENVS